MLCEEEDGAYDDFIRIVEVCALEAGGLDVEDEKGSIRLVRTKSKQRVPLSVVGNVGNVEERGCVAHGCGGQTRAFEGTLYHRPEIHRLFSPLTCSLFSSMADDLDDDFVPDIGGDDAAESVSFLELGQPTPAIVPTKKRKHREKDKQSKVHSLFFVFLSLAYHLLETKVH